MNPFVHYVQSGQTYFKYLAVFVLRCSCLKYVWQFFNMMHEKVKLYYSLCATNHLTCSEINLKWSTCFFFPLSVFCYSGDLFDSVLFTSIAPQTYLTDHWNKLFLHQNLQATSHPNPSVSKCPDSKWESNSTCCHFQHH